MTANGWRWWVWPDTTCHLIWPLKPPKIAEKSDFQVRNYTRMVGNRALETKRVNVWPQNTYPPLTHPQTRKVSEFGGPKLNRLKMLAVFRRGGAESAPPTRGRVNSATGNISVCITFEHPWCTISSFNGALMLYEAIRRKLILIFLILPYKAFWQHWITTCIIFNDLA